MEIDTFYFLFCVFVTIGFVARVTNKENMSAFQCVLLMIVGVLLMPFFLPVLLGGLLDKAIGKKDKL